MTWGFARLLPPVVEVEQSTANTPADVPFPEELASVARASPERLREFAMTRSCARQALIRLGRPPVPILSGPHREPLWPSGVVGSLTHCDGYRAAAVAYRKDLSTLGIDSELNEPLSDGILELIAVGDELDQLKRLGKLGSGVAWDKLLFSAKESIYKAWFPLTHAWLDFTECELVIQDSGGVFVGRLLVPGPTVGARQIEQFAGKWTICRGYILTAVWETFR